METWMPKMMTTVLHGPCMAIQLGGRHWIHPVYLEPKAVLEVYPRVSQQHRARRLGCLGRGLGRSLELGLGWGLGRSLELGLGRGLELGLGLGWATLF